MEVSELCVLKNGASGPGWYRATQKELDRAVRYNIKKNQEGCWRLPATRQEFEQRIEAGAQLDFHGGVIQLISRLSFDSKLLG